MIHNSGTENGNKPRFFTVSCLEIEISISSTSI